MAMLVCSRCLYRSVRPVHLVNSLSLIPITLPDATPPLLITTPPVRYSSSFIRPHTYINGGWTTAASGKTFQVTNPSDGSVLGAAPDMDVTDAEKAIEAAHEAFKTWRNVSPRERSAVLRRWYELIKENQDELAKIITLEMGKCLQESKVEVGYGADFVEWYSQEARRIYGDTIESPVHNKRIVTIKQPVGVASMITPWNFPNAMVTRKAAPAIATGCTVVLKPAEDTPFSAIALCDLAEKAGLPPGVLNVVTSSRENAGPVGEILCKHPLVSCISFTGSTAVGKILLNHAAEGVKKVSMELGGNAPFIVFDSANIKQAVTGAMQSKFRNSGQACVCTNRILVQEGVHDSFIAAMSEEMDRFLNVGEGLTEGATCGPLVNGRALDKIEQIIQDAKSKGASVVRGGEAHSLGGNFYKPTLLTNVNTNMLCLKEEIFGPVAPVQKFKTEEEALALANDTSYGLAGYVYSGDISQLWRMAEQLEFGIIGINEGLVSHVEGVFGGFKQSGLGREGSKYGTEEFLDVKYMCFGNI